MLSTLRRLTNLTLVEHTRLQQHTALPLGLRIELSAITLPRLWSLLPRIARSFTNRYTPILLVSA